MSKNFGNLLFALVTIVIAGGVYFYLKPQAPPVATQVMEQSLPAITPLSAPTAAPSEQASSQPSPSPSHYPVIEEKVKLPSLDESDESVLVAMKKLLGSLKFDSVFDMQDFIRKIVISVDSSTRKEIPKQSSPLKPTPGKFLLDEKDGKEFLSPRNYKRYAPYAAVLKKVDEKELVNTYLHFYPLFQAAFQDLGTGGYFNDRLIEVIDTLIATPVPEGPQQVFTTAIYYKYSNPKL